MPKAKVGNPTEPGESLLRCRAPLPLEGPQIMQAPVVGADGRGGPKENHGKTMGKAWENGDLAKKTMGISISMKFGD